MSEERLLASLGVAAVFALLGVLCSRKRLKHTLDSSTAETAPVGGLGGPCPPPLEPPSPDRRRAGHGDSSASAALPAGPAGGARTAARQRWHDAAKRLTRTTQPGVGLEGGAPPEPRSPQTEEKKWAVFVSHFKWEAATDARYVKEKLQEKLQQPIFIDSDDLHVLTKLKTHVCQSDVLVLVQTKSVLTRPYCLVELITACKHGVPIVGVCVSNGPNPYNRVEAEASLSDLEETLEPGDQEQLRSYGIHDLGEASYLLSCIPKIISVPIDFSASENVLEATFVDLKDKIDTARCNGPVEPPLTREEWERQKRVRKERSTAAAAAPAAAAPAAAAAAAPPPAAPRRRTPAEHSTSYRGTSRYLRQHVPLDPAHSRRVVQSSEDPLARRPARAVLAEAADQTLKISPGRVYLSG